MRFCIRELFTPKNISAALLNLTPPQTKNADNHLIGVIYQNLRHPHRLSPYRLYIAAPSALRNIFLPHYKV